MQKIQSTFRSLVWVCWSVILVATTYVFGAPVLKTLRRRQGRLAYWAIFTLIAAALVAADAKLIGLTLYSLVVLMGVFEEFEEMGLSFRVSAFFTLLINALLSAGAFALWVFYSGPKWSQIVRAQLEAALKPVMELNPRFQVDVSDLMLQLPSVALIAWAIAIYLSVLLERRSNETTSAPTNVATSSIPSLRPQLIQFKVPDACVWILILALLGAFGQFGLRWLEMLAINVLNVCIVLFFFQGIAVVAKFFESMRMNQYWQWVLMIFIVVQLFLFVSVLGLMDYWLDVRGRLEKRAAQYNRET